MKKKIGLCCLFILLSFVSPKIIYGGEEGEISTLVNGEIQELGLEDVDYYLIEQDMDVSFQDMVAEIAQSGLKLSVGEIVKSVLRIVFSEIVLQLGTVKKLLLMAIFCGLLKTLEDSFGGKTASELGFFVCYIIMVSIIMSAFYQHSRLALNTVEQLITLLKQMIPIFITLVAFSGEVTQGAILGAFIMSGAGGLSFIIQSIIIPFIGVTAMLDIANHISTTGMLGQLSNFFKKMVQLSLKGCAFGFMSLCTLQKIGGAGVSGLVGKTAKSAVGAVPVVGDIMSSAVEMAAGLTGLLRSSVTVATVIIVCVLVMTPVIKLFILCVIYKITAAVIEPIGEPRLIKALSSAGDFTALLMGAIFVVSSMFVFSTILLLTVV